MIVWIAGKYLSNILLHRILYLTSRFSVTINDNEICLQHTEYQELLIKKSRCAQQCDSLQPPRRSSVHGIFLAKILEWVCHFLFQGIFLTQVSNLRLLCLLHCKQMLYH